MLGKLFIISPSPPSQKKAVSLWQTFLNHFSLFSATKHDADIAMRASKAYKNIVDALFDAQQSLNDANNVINLLSDRVSSVFFFSFLPHHFYDEQP